MIYYDNKTSQSKGYSYVKNIDTSINKYTSQTKYFNNEKVTFEIGPKLASIKDKPALYRPSYRKNSPK